VCCYYVVVGCIDYILLWARLLVIVNYMFVGWCVCGVVCDTWDGGCIWVVVVPSHLRSVT